MIVKGLTRLDATLDLAGDTIPGKTTLILRSDDENLLKFAAALLNCPLSVFLIRAKYGASSYNGGVAFTTAMIDALPVPGGAVVRSEVAACVTRLLHAGQSGCDVPAVDDIAREINRRLYAAFGLSPRRSTSWKAAPARRHAGQADRAARRRRPGKSASLAHPRAGRTSWNGFASSVLPTRAAC